MAGWLRVEAHAIVDGAPLGVLRAIVEPTNAREGNGGCAHGARFQRHIEVGTSESFLTKLFARHANDGDFGMRGHVVELTRTVAGRCDNAAVKHQNRSDRHFAPFASGAGLVKRQLHKLICLHDPTIST
ncbi:hypothetical protein PMI09_04364 [Rhizobium sp. CF122]|nr:hypothetical protein PMI09_04364 [Rhizobium sp. CF122]